MPTFSIISLYHYQTFILSHSYVDCLQDILFYLQMFLLKCFPKNNNVITKYSSFSLFLIYLRMFPYLFFIPYFFSLFFLILFAYVSSSIILGVCGTQFENQWIGQWYQPWYYTAPCKVLGSWGISTVFRVNDVCGLCKFAD